MHLHYNDFSRLEDGNRNYFIIKQRALISLSRQLSRFYLLEQANVQIRRLQGDNTRLEQENTRLRHENINKHKIYF